VLFVSHNTGAVAELCTSAVLIDAGQKVAEGPVGQVLTAYSNLTSVHGGISQMEPDPRLPASITGLRLTDGDGVESSSFDIGDELRLTVEYHVARRVQGLQVATVLSRNMVSLVQSFDTDELSEVPAREPGTYLARYTIPAMFLKAGTYSLRLSMGTPEAMFQDFEPALTFEVEERSGNTHMRGYRRERPGHVISPGTWLTEKIG
jgi:lipopolysaccharide transport system ATP-binding protein